MSASVVPPKRWLGPHFIQPPVTECVMQLYPKSADLQGCMLVLSWAPGSPVATDIFPLRAGRTCPLIQTPCGSTSCTGSCRQWESCWSALKRLVKCFVLNRVGWNTVASDGLLRRWAQLLLATAHMPCARCLWSSQIGYLVSFWKHRPSLMMANSPVMEI